MSSEREFPGQGQSFSRPKDDDETSRLTASAPTVGSARLFDPATPVRTLASSDTASGARQQSGFGAGPVLGSGPEIPRYRGGQSGQNAAARARAPFVPSPAPDTLTTPALERALDWAYRWRTLLGLGLAGLTTAAVLLTYQFPLGDNQASSDTGAGSRTPLAAELSGSQTSEGVATQPGERQVNSAVDDDGTGEPVETEVSPSGPTATTAIDPQATTSLTTATSPSTAPVESTPSSTEQDSSTTTVETNDTTIDPSSTTSPDSTSSTLVGPSSSTTPTTIDATTSTVAGSTAVRVEAESGTVLGTARARSDHVGYSGSGFVGGITIQGSGVSLLVQAVGGPTPFTVRYSASPEEGPEGPRTISVFVNGAPVSEARMRLTKSWDDWDVVVGTLDLIAGVNIITLVTQPGDTGWVNIDYIEIPQ